MAHMIDADIQRVIPLKQKREKQVLGAAATLYGEIGSAPTSDQIARRLRYDGSPVSPNAVEVAQRHIRATTTTTNLRTGESTQGMSSQELGNVVANTQKMTAAEVQAREKSYPVVPPITVTKH